MEAKRKPTEEETLQKISRAYQQQMQDEETRHQLAVKQIQVEYVQELAKLEDERRKSGYYSKD